jgi:hypothetical protein
MTYFFQLYVTLSFFYFKENLKKSRIYVNYHFYFRWQANKKKLKTSDYINKQAHEVRKTQEIPGNGSNLLMSSYQVVKSS